MNVKAPIKYAAKRITSSSHDSQHEAAALPRLARPVASRKARKAIEASDTYNVSQLGRRVWPRACVYREREKEKEKETEREREKEREVCVSGLGCWLLFIAVSYKTHD